MSRQLSVQITTSNPEFGASAQRVTLSKWWPGGRATFHVANAGQWEKIAEIVSKDLGPILGWKTASELVASAQAKAASDRSRKTAYRDLMRQHPGFLREVVESIDPKKLSSADMERLGEVLGSVCDAVTNTNAGFREAFLSVVKKLPQQKQRALEDLDLLLQGWSLNVITNVAQQVRARLETITLFEKQIQDERTFEIIGENSIHRILERSMWLVDERYWLLHSNRTLQVQIGDGMSREDKRRYGSRRPDFVCGSYGGRLIILELKRPSHELKVDDLNQLEAYVLMAEKYQSVKSYEAYLVGTKTSDELRRTMRHRSNAFKTLTYSELIDQTKKRYAEFLTSIE